MRANPALWNSVHDLVNSDSNATRLADFIPLPEALALHQLVTRCPYRSRDAACGCSGHRCGLRSAIVSHRDCLDCVKRYG